MTGPDGLIHVAWWMTRVCVWRAGGTACRLTPSHPQPPTSLDALIVGGGDDIDPALYAGMDDGKAPRDPRRDRFETAMIEGALESGVPVLGICRGAQLLNVVLGGSLHQDLREVRKLTSNRRTVLPRKTVEVDQDCLLGRTLQTRRCKVNSLHHQAVDRTGDGLRVVARDLDQIVQAVESTDSRFLLGVQWHPEYLPYQPRQRRLFSRLVETARSQGDSYPAGRVAYSDPSTRGR